MIRTRLSRAPLRQERRWSGRSRISRMAGALDGSSIRSDIIGRLASLWLKVPEGGMLQVCEGSDDKGKRPEETGGAHQRRRAEPEVVSCFYGRLKVVPSHFLGFY